MVKPIERTDSGVIQYPVDRWECGCGGYFWWPQSDTAYPKACPHCGTKILTAKVGGKIFTVV